jgi:hypothetical protein
MDIRIKKISFIFDWFCKWRYLARKMYFYVELPGRKINFDGTPKHENETLFKSHTRIVSHSKHIITSKRVEKFHTKLLIRDVIRYFSHLKLTMICHIETDRVVAMLPFIFFANNWFSEVRSLSPRVRIFFEPCPAFFFVTMVLGWVELILN